ncbi:HET-domain-containing protein [Microthyrium microscopicum]|uniref:HET-domain-containing protein n=1 Tax=Microthyrium microscopicum TaxID=703497 RepID=A0A6A6UBU4_9PEZI|nr:HET-domain-containing protein [Microthyrium microscopicum]
MPPSVTCPICNNLDPRNHPSSRHRDTPGRNASASQDVSLYLPLDALSLARTRRKCRFCDVLVQALDGCLPDRGSRRAKMGLEIGWKKSVRISVFDGGDVVEVYRGSDQPSPWPALGSVVDIPRRADSEETFDFLRACVEKCKLDHECTCGGSKAKSRVSAPARLLKISKDGKSIKLVICSKRSPAYVALSHCWGNDLPMTTTQQNLSHQENGFAVSELPPLYQDSIEVVRQLGLEHIWIDSLCIVQDLIQDWTKESTKMAAIYSDADFTIAATGTKDSSHRFLDSTRKRARVSYTNTKDKKFVLRSRLVQSHHPKLDLKRPAALIGPLTHRAWTLQEHVMSTRIFHFTASEVVFECCASFSCQCKPTLKKWPTTPGIFQEISSCKSARLKHEEWHRLVEQYTRRSLTRPADKFPALSGLASEFQGLVNSKYCAGLWESNFLVDLQWFSAPWLESPITPQTLETYRAPSFSWASTDTQVSYDQYNDDYLESVEFLTSVTEIHIETDPLNIFGAVGLNSYAKLRGPTMHATLVAPETSDDDSFHYFLRICDYPSAHVYPDCRLVVDNDNSEFLRETEIRRHRPGDEYSAFQANVLCLVLCVSGRLEMAHGLVLGLPSRKLGHNNQSNTYERVGYFSCGSDAIMDDTEQDIVLI